MEILNVASIFIGIIAITKPIIEIDTKTMQSNYESIISCIIAILLQICYNIYLINIKNITAIEQILNVTTKTTEFLIITTILVNIISITKKNLNKKHAHN